MLESGPNCLRREFGSCGWQDLPHHPLRKGRALGQVTRYLVHPRFQTRDTLEIRLVLQRKDHLDVFRVSAAGGAVQGLHQFTVEDHHLTGGFRDGLVGEGMLDLHSAVYLAAWGGADVVALVGELPEVLQGVGSGKPPFAP